jgi:predicted nucleic acid-binding protein
VKYYLDTSIWRDYYENRSDNLRPLGEWALMLLRKIILEGSIILYSDFVIEELKKGYNQNDVEKIFQIAEGSILKVKINPEDVSKAAILSKTRKVSFGDALHAILAKNNNAILISRDAHFRELSDIAIIKKPEELI